MVKNNEVIEWYETSFTKLFVILKLSRCLLADSTNYGNIMTKNIGECKKSSIHQKIVCKITLLFSIKTSKLLVEYKKY